MTETFAVIAAVLLVARLVMFVALHVRPSPYNVVEHAVSDYAVGPTRRLSTAMTWTTGVAWVAMAVATIGVGQWPDRTSIAVQFFMLAAIFMILPFLPTDVEGERHTRTGLIHYLAAIAWFAVCTSLTGNLTRHLGSVAVLGGILTILRWVVIVSLGVSVIALVVRMLRPRLFGISERVFILAVNLYFLLAAIAMLVR